MYTERVVKHIRREARMIDTDVPGVSLTQCSSVDAYSTGDVVC